MDFVIVLPNIEVGAKTSALKTAQCTMHVLLAWSREQQVGYFNDAILSLRCILANSAQPAWLALTNGDDDSWMIGGWAKYYLY